MNKCLWGVLLAVLARMAAQEIAPANSLGMVFIRVLPGEFEMGCSPGDDNCYGNERPPHLVKITKPFYLGKYEVTQEQWGRLMGYNPSYWGESRVGAEWRRYPVEQVSWNETRKFLYRLSEGQKGWRYRLPTEAEWEYAARAGVEGPYQGEVPGVTGWYWSNSGGQTHPIGEALPNAWGFHDMLGNVWEWCEDWFGKGYYSRHSVQDPAGQPSGRYKVARGGSWYFNERCFRVSFRYNYEPTYRDYSGGFRCVATPVP